MKPSLLRDDAILVIDEDHESGAGVHLALNDLDLLSAALHDALSAQEDGLIIGPPVDEMTLRRAERRARRADGRRALAPLVLGGAA